MSRALRFFYLADECLALKFVDGLKAAGLDVQWIGEFDRSAPDLRVLAHATERQRILLTEDFDFGELTVKDRLKAMGVVILALHRLKIAQRCDIVLRELDAHAEQLVGHLLIIEPGRTRLRLLDA